MRFTVRDYYKTVTSIDIMMQSRKGKQKVFVAVLEGLSVDHKMIIKMENQLPNVGI